MKNIKYIKLIAGIILIFLTSVFVQAAEECERVEAVFSWTVQEEEVASNFTVTSNDAGRVMPGCSMFEVEEFSGNKLVLVCPQDESIRAIVISGDIGKKPTYYWEEFGTTETICDLELVEFDGNKRSATFGIIEEVEKIKNKTITSDDAGKWFELDSCSVKVNEFDVKSGELLIDGMTKPITSDNVGKDIFFDECKWKLEKFGCIVEKTGNTLVRSVREIQVEIENNSKNITVNGSKDISNNKKEININAITEKENKSDSRIIKNENLNFCNGLKAGEFCIPVLAVIVLIVIILFVIALLILMIFSLIKK